MSQVIYKYQASEIFTFEKSIKDFKVMVGYSAAGDICCQNFHQNPTLVTNTEMVTVVDKAD